MSVGLKSWLYRLFSKSFNNSKPFYTGKANKYKLTLYNRIKKFQDITVSKTNIKLFNDFVNYFYCNCKDNLYFLLRSKFKKTSVA